MEYRRLGDSDLNVSRTAQMACLELMTKKIAEAQSTSGDTPESGLDVLNQ